jgi:putative peptidoglycan lipid II flippase
MVRRIFKLFYREFGGMHEAAYLLGAFAIFSQVLGLVRDRLLAHSFGASSVLDVYYAAFRIPDFLFVSVASFASATVLVPFFLEKMNLGDEHAKKFLNDIFTIFFSAILLASLAAFIFIPELSFFIAPGFSETDREALIFLSRLLLVSPILLGLSNLLGGITQAFNKFFVFALSPVLYNLGIIIGIAVLYPIFGLTGIILGVLLGAFFHLAIQIPVIIREGFIPKFSFSIDFQSIKKVLILSLPRTFALSVGHISILALISLASLISAGSISIFQLSFNLQSVPLSIIGVSYSVAAFPTLSRLFSAGEKQKFFDHVANAARHIIFWSVPVIFLFIVLRAQIVRVILGSGAFNWNDTRLTAAALALFTISLVAQSIVLLFTRGYYAAGNTKKPLFINTISSIFIIISAFFLLGAFSDVPAFKNIMEHLLKIENIAGSGVIMLPLAFTLGMIMNALFLWIFFQKDFGNFTREISQSFFHSLSASCVTGFVAYQFLAVFSRVFDLNTFLGIFFQGFFSGILGIMAGILVLHFLKNREFETVKKGFAKKFWTSHPVVPGQEGL